MFAPSWLMTGLTVLLCVLFFSLGRWQWQRFHMHISRDFQAFWRISETSESDDHDDLCNQFRQMDL